MFDQIIRSPVGQALIQVEAECLVQFGAFCDLFGPAFLLPFYQSRCLTVQLEPCGSNAEQIAERIERELRLGLGVYALDAAERRMQRAG